MQPVVWSEGMHLAQHHFQAQGRYFEDLTSFLFSNLFFGAYGYAGLQLDQEALINGTIAIVHARGVMPDGTPFDFPEEMPPGPLGVGDDFGPTRESLSVFLALPAYRADRANCKTGDASPNGDARYEASTVMIADETTGQSARAVDLARKNFRVCLEDEPTDELVTLPLARVRRDGSGHFIYDPDYVPPCLKIGASSRLMAQLSRIVDLLESKADALERERVNAGDPAEYASRDVANFWMTHAVHSALGPLRHMLVTRASHPEQLFRELSRLAGALCTFSIQGDPRALPAYDHEDAGPIFLSLERHVRDHLDVFLPVNSVAVPLRGDGAGYFRGALTDDRVLRGGRWYLGVRSKASDQTVPTQVPRLVKVCSSEHIEKLVKRAYPGLELDYVPVPPSDISPRVGMHYFAIDTNPPSQSPGEPCWKLILESSTVGFFVPDAIADAELTLSIVVGT